MQVIKPQTKVYLGDSESKFEAVVVRVIISSSGCYYECEWWDGRTVRIAAFAEWQVEVRGETEKLQIGFRGDSSD